MKFPAFSFKNEPVWMLILSFAPLAIASLGLLIMYLVRLLVR